MSPALQCLVSWSESFLLIAWAGRQVSVGVKYCTLIGSTVKCQENRELSILKASLIDSCL